jgi:hypothetical protein
MSKIPEELVRQRSYEIWQREGCPVGLALKHWFQAETELENESRLERWTAIGSYYRHVVSPRPPISLPPRKLVARRLHEQDHPRAA